MRPDPRIQTVPVRNPPKVRTSPPAANLAGKDATPRTNVLTFCEHCGEKIQMTRGTDYWFHVRTRVEACGP